MKKTVIPGLLMALLSIGVSFAQTDFPNIVKYNAGALLETTFSAGFERAINDKHSFQVNVDYHTEKDMDFLGGDRYSGLGISGEYRLYGLIPALKTDDKPVLNGLFFGPSLAYRKITYKSLDRSDPFDESISLVQLGGVAGYQYRPKSVPRLSLEASLALLASLSFGEDADTWGEDMGIGVRFNSGIVPVFSLSVGYAFGSVKKR
ncbi:MAG: hypothetical protein ACO1N1_17490 [Dyadobacter fermentans]